MDSAGKSISDMVRMYEVTAARGLSSGSSPVFPDRPVSTPRDKRNLSAISLASEDEMGVKQARFEDSSPSSPSSSTESTLLAVLQASLTGFTDNLNAKMDSLDRNLNETVNSQLESINHKLDDRFDRLETRLDSLESRLGAVEAEGASSRAVVSGISDRLEVLEARTDSTSERMLRLESVPSVSGGVGGWVPSGPTGVNILLLGDSNSGGKLKFGEGKGKLGAALPGKDEFCAKFENLPAPDSALFNNTSDIVLAVGTNNLKSQSSDPSTLATKLHEYLVALNRNFPATHVHLTGVLPICTPGSATNTKIRTYNHYLSDMALTFPRVSYIDTKVFQDRDGSLRSKFAMGTSDPLHLNGEGLRLYFSRMKFSLRDRHRLPMPSHSNPRGVASNRANQPRANRDQPRA